MPEENQIQDWQQFADFREGKEAAYDYFFRKYFRSLCYYASGMTGDAFSAEDIVQDCFLKFWEHRTSRLIHRDIRSYLYTTVRNAVIDALRKQKRQQVKVADFIHTIQFEDTASDHLLIEAELIRNIYKSIPLLPARIRQVFTLYYEEGKSYQEISEILSTSPETIRKQKSRAIAILKGLLFSFLIIFI